MSATSDLSVTDAVDLFLQAVDAAAMRLAAGLGLTDTPAFAGLLLTKVTEQLRIRYDSTHYLATTVDANGVVMWNNPTDIDYRWQFGGNTYMRFGSNALTVTLPFGSFYVDSAGQYAAGRPRFSVGSAADSGPGISDGGAVSTLGLCIGGTDYVLVTPTLFTTLIPAILFVTTVGGLPAAAAGNLGARAFVTDALTTLILGLGTSVAAGGSNKVPVYSNGSNWIYG